MRLPVLAVLAAASVFASTSKSFALTCEGSGDQLLCIELPAEARESAVEAQAPIAEKVPTTMVTANDLNIDADITDADIAGVELETGLIPSNANQAFIASNTVTERIRSIETYLKANPAFDQLDGKVTISDDSKKKK